MPVAFSTCPLCEATCGLRITVEDGAVTGIRGDADDVLSHGFVCPKGASLRELPDDPARVRTPLLRAPRHPRRPRRPPQPRLRLPQGRLAARAARRPRPRAHAAPARARRRPAP